jgi:hypothetical protein
MVMMISTIIIQSLDDNLDHHPEILIMMISMITRGSLG